MSHQDSEIHAIRTRTNSARNEFIAIERHPNRRMAELFRDTRHGFARGK